MLRTPSRLWPSNLPRHDRPIRSNPAMIARHGNSGVPPSLKGAECRQGPHQKEVLMKFLYLRSILFTALLACFVPLSMSAANSNPRSREFAADAGWKFFLGDPSGAEAPSFADASWRS